MYGIRKSVRTRVLEIEPRALFIGHCFNHSLNPALQDAAKAVPLVRDSSKWTHDVSVLVKTSPKRLHRFKELRRIAEHEEDFDDSVSPGSETEENSRRLPFHGHFALRGSQHAQRH